MTSAKSQEEEACGKTAQEFDSSTFPLVRTSNFGRGDSSGLKTDSQTTPAKRQDNSKFERNGRSVSSTNPQMPPAKRQEREDNEERLFSGGKTANFEATEFELVLPAGGVEEPTSLSAAVRGARCMVLWCFSLLSHCCLTRVGHAVVPGTGEDRSWLHLHKQLLKDDRRFNAEGLEIVKMSMSETVAQLTADRADLKLADYHLAESNYRFDVVQI